jgi:DNA-binding beta-propeller fold protein YncE
MKPSANCYHTRSSHLSAAVVLLALVPQVQAQAQTAPTYTQPLSTGERLDPVGESVNLGSMPVAMALAPGGDKLAVVLSGWREQGVQIVDLKSKQVLQTLTQPSAFLGVVFSHDGKRLFVSGGNEDAIFCYSWHDGTATFDRKIVLAEKAPEKPGSRYPAGLALSRRGNYLYVAENVGDSLAVVDLASFQVVERFPTDHYPYAVEATSTDKVYVSAWAADTLAEFKAKPNGRLTPVGKLKVGPRPSALLSNRNGTQLFAALAGRDQIAVIDTERDKVVRYLSDAAPAGPSEGSTPNGLALSKDETHLFVAEADNNSVAIFDLSKASGAAKSPLQGRIPTDWYPTAVLDSEGELLVLNGKGHAAMRIRTDPFPVNQLPDLWATTWGS